LIFEKKEHLNSKSMKKISNAIAIILLIFALGCNSTSKKESAEKVDKDYSIEYAYLTLEQLNSLGIQVKDSSIMYNNAVDGAGGLNITIRDKGYYLEIASIDQTNFNFYPRYITTLDTVQRAMYRLTGDQSNSMEEAQKWEKFESLVPVVVEQVEDNTRFGETLVFWFTKTPELEKMLDEFYKE